MSTAVVIPAVLDADALAGIRLLLRDAPWESGAMSAGEQALRAKQNQQLPSDGAAARTARTQVLRALDANAAFFTHALPKRLVPPQFNRYRGDTNRYGPHVDNAIRFAADSRLKVRSDLSVTLFLSDPADYDGGELCIGEDLPWSGGAARHKLAAGDLLLYPATEVHQVLPVTRGERLACFFWIESMVRLAEHRRLLVDLDHSIRELRQRLGETPETIRLTGLYHNLLRQWADS